MERDSYPDVAAGAIHTAQNHSDRASALPHPKCSAHGSMYHPGQQNRTTMAAPIRRRSPDETYSMSVRTCRPQTDIGSLVLFCEIHLLQKAPSKQPHVAQEKVVGWSCPTPEWDGKICDTDHRAALGDTRCVRSAIAMARSSHSYLGLFIVLSEVVLYARMFL